MTSQLIRFSLRSRLAVLLVAVGVAAFGVQQARSAPVDVLPEVKAPYVEVQTEALGLSAQEVEQLVTSPMESDLLNGVAFLDEIRSESVAGLSSIQLYFEPGTDVLRARQMVQERLTEARALPNVTKAPSMIQPLSSTGRVMMIGLSSKDVSLIDLSVLSRWTIKPTLLGVPGVANVAVFGQRERQLQVQVDPEQLRRSDVSLSQVVETTANSLWVSPLSFVEASTPGTGGFIDTPQQRIGIQHVLPVTGAADLARISLGRKDGGPGTLGDVATVTEDHQPLIGDAPGESGPQLLLVVEKFPGASTLEVTRGVESAMASLAPGLRGVDVDTKVYRPAAYVEESLDNLGIAVLVGLLLMFLGSIALLRSWRVALICLVTVPISVVVAVIVLQLTGTTFNTLVLAGLVVALGVVVDGVVVAADAVSRRLHRRHSEDEQVSPAGTVVEGTLGGLQGPLLFATLAVLVVVAPLLVLDGVTGALFRPLVLSYGLAVLCATAVVLLLTPALAMLLLAGGQADRPDPVVARWASSVYGRLLPRWSGARVLAPAVLVLGLLVGAVTLPLLDDGGTLPDRRDRDLLLRWDAPPGTSLPAMTAATTAAAADLRALPGLRSVGAHVGRAVTSDKVVGINSGELWLSLHAEADYEDTVAEAERVLARHPGLGRDPVAYPEQRLADLGPQSDRPIVVRIFGVEADELERRAQEVRDRLDRTDGVVATRLSADPQEPTVQIEVDLDRAQAFGLKPGDVRRAAATLVAGIQVGSIFEQQKVFDVVVVGQPATRDSLDDVRGLLLDTPSGRSVRLDQVADVRMTPAPVVIRHDAVSRYVDVSAGVQGRDVGDVARDVERGLRDLALPLGYHAQLLDQESERRTGTAGLLLVLSAALVVAFLLLQAAFASWRLAGVLFVALPAGLAGGALAAVLQDGGPARTTLFGLVAVLGIAARNGVVLLTRLEELPRDVGQRPAPELVHRAAQERLLPVLTTAVATAALLLPFLVLGNRPGFELVRPLALVVLGGLVTSTLVTLLVLPSLYLRTAPRGEPLEPPGTSGLDHAMLPRQRQAEGQERSDAPA